MAHISDANDEKGTFTFSPPWGAEGCCAEKENVPFSSLFFAFLRSAREAPGSPGGSPRGAALGIVLYLPRPARLAAHRKMRHPCP